MNTIFSRPRRLIAGIILAAVALLLGACREKRLIWSPDGARAAVISREGLHLCDADGRLSPLLVPDVEAMAWLPDSRRLVLVRTKEIGDWATVAPLAGAARSEMEARAEDLWQQLSRGAPWSVLSIELNGNKSAVKLCLRDHHRDALKSRLSESEWAGLEKVSVKVSELLVARLNGDSLELGPVWLTQWGDAIDLRPAPNGRLLAWTRERASAKDEYELVVASLDASAPPTVVSNRTSAFADWTPDGRSLCYVESPRTDAPQKDDAIVLGVLTRREVVDASGHVALSDKPEYLAGLLFNIFSRVRCLRDGRIIFNGVEMSLPLAAADYAGDHREQLFAVDPARQATLVRLVPRGQEMDLPQMLSFFEVSPDEQQILIGGTKNEVAVFTLATGEVRRIQGGEKDAPQGLPVWRRAGEFSYVKHLTKGGNEKPSRSYEIVLRQGDKETVLSKAWTDETLGSVANSPIERY